MSSVKKFPLRLHSKMLKDPDYLSGYEYAKKMAELWNGQSPDELAVFAQAYFQLYKRDQNRHSLGMAMFLRRLADTGPRSSKTTKK